MSEQPIEVTQGKTEKTYTLAELEKTYFQLPLTIHAVKKCMLFRIECNLAATGRDVLEAQLNLELALKDWLYSVGQYRDIDGVSMYLRGEPWIVRREDQPNEGEEENIIMFSQLEAEVADYL